ncbi:4'-phosphopantetheinyl transferase superfamily protein [Ornithinimicrobium faecis]|uniref:4'-phosphopantetheinyl transferase superfamily protein n=1 Tax=Ornithinimicrobium faecis TaxID=2934158 RepID=A0ABY4YVR9_9MICO|nr:4'-phosphopantetheinyl transferase superfamily protein [Ornithinimicrobium sp. HY1793]USQ80830.1 4'-phosphopantetheinyl transferase superfamily protein [Ornithinimicrobium sp. HY1793]
MTVRVEDSAARWPQAGTAIVEWTPRARLTVERAWLSPEELTRGQRLVPPLGEQWLAARCWVRARLALRLGCDPADVPLLADERGRLFLDGCVGPGDFNVSHTQHVLALAVSGSRVGVDVEEAPPAGEDLVALAQVVGTVEEVDQLRHLPETERSAAFQRWWVRKEAVLKADGAGFLSDPRLVHVGVTQVEAPEPWTVLDHGPLRHPDAEVTSPHTLLATAHDTPSGAVSTRVLQVSTSTTLR